MKTFKEIFTQYGFTARKAAQCGIPYDTICKHIQGLRNVGVFAAIRYEQKLGIPRWELRPDLWEPPHEQQAASHNA